MSICTTAISRWIFFKSKYLYQLSIRHFSVRVQLLTVVKLNTSKIKGTAPIIYPDLTEAAVGFELRYQHQVSLPSVWTLVSLPLEFLRFIEKWNLNFVYIDSRLSQDCCSDLLLETFSWWLLLNICELHWCTIFSNVHKFDFGFYLPNSYMAYWKLPQVEIWLLKWPSISMHSYVQINSSQNGFESEFILKINITNLLLGKPMITHLRMPKHLCQKESLCIQISNYIN